MSLPYTHCAQTIFDQSKTVAKQLGHDHIRPEHFLLSLIKCGEGGGLLVLKALRVPLGEIFEEVVALVGSNKQILSDARLPWTRPARRVLGLAHKEAARLRHGYIGSEHILIGLILEDESWAAQVLADHHVNFRAVRPVIRTISTTANY